MTVTLSVDGQILAPEKIDDREFWFRVGLPARDVRPRSGYARPMDLEPSDDQRHLGVAVYGVHWEQADASLDTPMESAGFLDGFLHVESDVADNVQFRWTTGNAGLPSVSLPPWQGDAWLRLTLRVWEGSSHMTRPVTSLAAFESLGENCELALAQRASGGEPPLGLLTWSSTTYAQLIQGLECRFEGLGDPASTSIAWTPTDYRLDTPYLRMHTTVVEERDAEGAAEVLRQGCATLRLLRRKLLRDIASAKRIFVFKSRDPELGHDAMRRMYQAMRAIGPVSLLWVTLKSTRQPRGVIEQLEEGLFAGYLDNFAGPEGPFDEWNILCAKVLQLHDIAGDSTP